MKGTAPPAGRLRAALGTGEPPHPARAASSLPRGPALAARPRSQLAAGVGCGAAPSPARLAPSVGVAVQGRALRRERPGTRRGSPDANRPPESGRRLAAARLRAPPQPAASSAAGAPRPAAPLARRPRAPPSSPHWLHRAPRPLRAYAQLATYAEPLPGPPHWLPARPAPGGAQGVRRRRGPRAPGSTRAPNRLTARKSAAFRGAGGAWGRCLAARPG